jgi:hypothetical protein
MALVVSLPALGSEKIINATPHSAFSLPHLSSIT